MWDPNQLTYVTSTSPTGHIDPRLIDVVRKSTPSDWEFRVAVGAISREGSISDPGLAPLTP